MTDITPADLAKFVRRPSQTCQTCGDSEEVRPDGLVAVMCKIAARGKILTDDLVAIEPAGITLRIEVAYTRGRP